ASHTPGSSARSPRGPRPASPRSQDPPPCSPSQLPPLSQPPRPLPRRHRPKVEPVPASHASDLPLHVVRNQQREATPLHRLRRQHDRPALILQVVTLLHI